MASKLNDTLKGDTNRLEDKIDSLDERLRNLENRMEGKLDLDGSIDDPVRQIDSHLGQHLIHQVAQEVYRMIEQKQANNG